VVAHRTGMDGIESTRKSAPGAAVHDKTKYSARRFCR